MNRISALSGGIAELRRRVRGAVTLPGDEAYDQERTGFQLHEPRTPDVIVTATDTDDVRGAVAFAAEHGLPVAVLSAGHGLGAFIDGGMLIRTSGLRELHVDPQRRSARMAAGVQWQQVIEAAAPYGLAPLSGSTPLVGAVSYVLGGGIGLLARKFGYAADHVRGLELVTPDGRLRQVTADSDPDLFWAVRGAGGNFGVVTSLEVDLFPVSSLYGGSLYFDPTGVPEVLRQWIRWTADVPDDMTTSIAMIPFPDVPFLPPMLRGRHVLQLRVAYAGDSVTGERLVAPLRAAGPVLLDGLGEVPYLKSETICNDPTDPNPFYSTNAMLEDLDSADADAIMSIAGPGGKFPCVVEIRHLGGALARPATVPNAVGHRDARFLLGVGSRFSSQVPGAEELDRVRVTHRTVLDTVRARSRGQYLNFLSGESADIDAVRASYDSQDYVRLTQLKAQYDPNNLFRLNHNIPPVAVR
ncbi:FAD-binding oxidoreductase [Pseudonocardiaceae bacterium YIM PH 21723]|nr:FAD-binding oxidoreductase [Pseudonocardiaceae bacterium YIM PH 21723]